MKPASLALAGAASLALCFAAQAEAAEGRYVLKTDHGVLEIDALREDVLRVRIARDVLPEDASFAVRPEQREAHVPMQVEEGADSIVLKTPRLQARLSRRDFHLTILDSEGKVLLDDAAPETTPLSYENKGFRLKKAMAPDAHYFGLGDKTGGLDRRGQAFANWNTDAFLFQDWSDPLYKSIPFVLQADERGRSLGLFLDNTWRTSFDFGRTERDRLVIGAEGGPIDYYILAGPDPRQVVEAYGWLTGVQPLAPRWSLGFQQSRWSYPTEAKAREIVSRLKADKIPSDVLYLDIDYQDRDRPFTVNKAAFPDLQRMVADFKAAGVHTILITDLHIAKADYPPYATGKAIDAFVKDPDGKDFVGPVWPGAALFPDFSRKTVRDWWGGLYADFVHMGVGGFWNDMNEPAVFLTRSKTMPLNVIHHIDQPGFAPRAASHLEMHNLVGMLNSQGTYEGLLKLDPDHRPFVLTRASFAGGQRYAATWTGDNTSSFAHINLSISQLSNLGLSGFAYAGDDIGGFAGHAPSPELLTRWIEIGAFNPIFRDHAEYHKPPQEVWAQGAEQEAIRRRFIEERYRLMPYIYSLAEENSRTGLPIMRPVFLDYPVVLSRIDADFGMGGSFLLGRDLLVAPSTTIESPQDYVVSLPGAGWYDYWSGLQLRPSSARNPSTDGPLSPHETIETPRLDRLPVFVRPGAIIPRQPLVQSTMEAPDGPLELHVYRGEDCRGSLYWDDGETFAYKRGEFLRQAFACDSAAGKLSFLIGAREGRFAPWWKTVRLVVHGWTEGEAKAALDSKALAAKYDAAAQTLTLDLPDTATAARVEIASR